MLDGNATRVTTSTTCSGWEVQTSAAPLSSVLLQNCSNYEVEATFSYLAGKLTEPAFGSMVQLSLLTSAPGFSERSGHAAIVV